jgi:hypothetical protein
MGQMNALETGFLSNLFGQRTNLASRLQGTSTRQRTRTDAPLFTL